MITLKRLNEVRQVASEERAAKLEQKITSSPLEISTN